MNTLTLIRKSKGFTSSQVAAELGITQGHYSHLENGTRRLTSEQVSKLSRLLGVSVDEIEKAIAYTIKQRDELNHWIAKINYNGQPLVNTLLKELRFTNQSQLKEDDELAFVLAHIASSLLKQEIYRDFTKDPELLKFFRTKM